MLHRAVVLLGLLAPASGQPPPPESARKLVMIESPAHVGLSLRELPPSVLKSIGLPYGLAGVRADGMAGRAGPRMGDGAAGRAGRACRGRGDVVYGVNQQRLKSVEDFRRLVGQPGDNASTRLLVRRGR